MHTERWLLTSKEEALVETNFNSSLSPFLRCQLFFPLASMAFSVGLKVSLVHGLHSTELVVM